jgi:hypothetical protein
VYILTFAFKNSHAPYNVLDDATSVCTGLDALPPDQCFHANVAAGTPNMIYSACKCCIILPIPWYQEVAHQFPDRINVKEFHDWFLAPVAPADRPALNEVFTWWRQAASRSAGTTARLHLGLQVATSQALTPATRARREAWA